MKPHALFSGVFAYSLLLAGCHSGPMMSRATGAPYEIVVMMRDKEWEGAAGEAVRNDLESDVPGLPQSEAAFRIMRTNPDKASDLLTYVRNIVIVNIDDKMYTAAAMSYENDRWANDQVVLTVHAPDEQSLVAFLNTRRNEICRFFTKAEMNRATEYLATDFSLKARDTLRQHLNVLLNVPADMKFMRCAEDFFWASNNAKTGRIDMMVYTFPYTDANTFTGEYLIAKRDSVLKINLPGAFPNSYMATATADYSPATVRGKYCGVLRGLWEMVGDMMGGPFVCHARLDEANNRVVVAEGFVYAPETNKRNYIRKAEAALYTLRLPGEFDQPVAGGIK
jgi:hypothetical protein